MYVTTYVCVCVCVCVIFFIHSTLFILLFFSDQIKAESTRVKYVYLSNQCISTVQNPTQVKVQKYYNWIALTKTNYILYIIIFYHYKLSNPDESMRSVEPVVSTTLCTVSSLIQWLMGEKKKKCWFTLFYYFGLFSDIFREVFAKKKLKDTLHGNNRDWESNKSVKHYSTTITVYKKKNYNKSQ